MDTINISIRKQDPDTKTVFGGELLIMLEDFYAMPSDLFKQQVRDLLIKMAIDEVKKKCKE